MLCALIMAGGIGKRFWPQSTEKKPKQFLNLVGDKTMIQMTYDRVNRLIDKDKIFIITNENYAKIVKKQLKGISDKNIIVEPSGRNTAPCILLSCLYINQIFGDVNIAVLPSDHIINNEDEFLKTISIANDYITDKGVNNIVTIGINPSRPETGYGYIKTDGNKEIGKITNVEKFVEKPNFEKAVEYLRNGSYLWNAGMFIFNTKFMLTELEKNCHETYEMLSELPSIDSKQYMDELKKVYPNCESISIDYAVMEKSKSIKVIPSDFGWDDVGTWQSLERYLNKDNNNNICNGSNVEFWDSKNCVAYGLSKKIVLYDVNDLFVTEGQDVIVITKKENMNDVCTLRKN